MMKVITKKQLKRLYEITKKEKYNFPYTTPELLKLCHVEYQEKLEYLDEEILRANESYKFVPFIYINYLAVQSEYQNNKIGTILLMNALQKCAHTITNIGIYGVALHAISDRVAGLYDRYGFRQCGKSSKFPFMILPAQSVLDLFIKQ